MSLNRTEKAAVVTDVAAQVARSQTLALAEYRGLTVENLNKLRVEARGVARRGGALPAEQPRPIDQAAEAVGERELQQPHA